MSDYPLNEWIGAVALNKYQNDELLSALCKHIADAPTFKAGDPLPELPTGEYKLLLWGRHD